MSLAASADIKSKSKCTKLLELSRRKLSKYYYTEIEVRHLAAFSTLVQWGSSLLPFDDISFGHKVATWASCILWQQGQIDWCICPCECEIIYKRHQLNTCCYTNHEPCATIVFQSFVIATKHNYHIRCLYQNYIYIFAVFLLFHVILTLINSLVSFVTGHVGVNIAWAALENAQQKVW